MEKEFHRPAFRKIFSHNINYHAIRIPTNFLHQLGKEVPDTAILTVSSGQSWMVKVVKEENEISLQDGWHKFRDDNNLSPLEVLLFRYYPNWIFDVTIYSPQGKQRKAEVEPSIVHQNQRNLRKEGDPGLREEKTMIDHGEKGKEDGLSTICRKQNNSRYNINSGNEARNNGRACWKDRNIAKRFLDLCLEGAVKSGSHNLRDIPFNDIRLTLQKEEGIKFSVTQLKDRLKNEKMRYIVWSKLIAAAGKTHYDPKTNKVNWSKKKWEDYLKMHPEAAQFVNQQLEYRTEMMMLFED